MGFFVIDAANDDLLAELATCDRMDVTSDVGTPTDLTNTLANVALTPGDGNGDFTIADGAIDGRKLTVTQQTAIPITSSGTAKHVVLSLSSVIKYVTTCSDQALTSGGSPVTVPEFDHTIRDPSAV